MDPKQTLSRRHAVVSIAALPLLACGGGSGPRSVRAEDFTLLAADFVGGVQFIDGNVRVAINASGQVAFVATELPPPASGFSQALFVANGGALVTLQGATNWLASPSSP